ncbi:MAG: OmpH family outer membrane protein [Pleurocapsa sp. SU_196_0]|jgi:outer membrane protein|nr:OmpH family outer membrane protein [Pleurocapsa sp. SU_196_0]
MKKILPILLAVAATAAFTVPLAQTRATRIGFVTAQKVLENHPQGKGVLDQRKKAEEELKPLQAQIVALQQKIGTGSATAAERQQYETLVKSYQTRLKALQDKQNKLLEPITKQVDAAVGKVAKAQGYVLVMDRAIAASSGLVIYADPEGTDLTDEVIAEVKK